MDSVVGTLVPGLVPCIDDLTPWLDLGLPHHYRWSGNHQPGPSPVTVTRPALLLLLRYCRTAPLNAVPCCHPQLLASLPLQSSRSRLLPDCYSAAGAGGRTWASSRDPNVASRSCTSSGLSTRSKATQLCCIRAAPRLLQGWGELAEEDYRERWMEASQSYYSLSMHSGPWIYQ